MLLIQVYYGILFIYIYRIDEYIFFFLQRHIVHHLDFEA